MTTLNPLASNIKQIFIGSESSGGFFPIIGTKLKCQYERIEFVESVFELFPSGALVVRDTSDIATAIRSGGLDTIKIEYGNGKIEHFFITSVSGLNNLASSTEENFLTINFSNQLFKINQNTGIADMGIQYPKVVNFEKWLESDVKPHLNSNISPAFIPATVKNLTNAKSSNYIVVRPINPTEEKTDVASENIIQYLYYLSSLLCDNSAILPRFLFWTGFNNDLNLRYVPDNLSTDTSFDVNNRSYAVFEGDGSTIIKNSITYKKIYILFSSPSSQYLNRNYYYNRKTPKILKSYASYDATDYNNYLFNHQFLGEGDKYDYDLVTDSTTFVVPPNRGYSELTYDGNYGYYHKNDVDNNFKLSSNLMMDYSNKQNYLNISFMGANSPYPFIDNPEMWKNIFDMTDIHPDTGFYWAIGPKSCDINPATTKLQKVYEIRQNTKPLTDKEDLIRDIEKQNFVYYVLCCLAEQTEEEEETFFACITGAIKDTTATYSGPNNKPLIWRYSWKKLNLLLDSDNNFNNLSNPENRDLGYNFYDYSSTEESDQNDILTWAINLNERKNIGGDYAYYGPGWYVANLGLNLFSQVRYKEIGKGGNATGTRLPGETCMHIVKMHKVPYIKIIKDAENFDTFASDETVLENLINNSAGKYVYYFELSNVLDGPCTTP